jgi:hypothetical protein
MLVAAFVLACLPSPALAQYGPNSGDVHVAGTVDVTSAYYFRGIRQETEGFIIQPSLDVGFTLFKGEGSLKSFSVNTGLWNSLHQGGLSGSHNEAPLPNQHKLWYESDFYATLGFAVAGNVNVGLTYTAYTSPNGQFTTVKEFSVKFAVDDAPFLPTDYKKFSVKPYGIIAMELDTATGTGQADGSYCQGNFVSGCVGAGTYIELGATPTYTKDWWTLSVPFKVGIGLIDYYQALYIDPATNQAVGLDSKFGFFSVALIGTVPFKSGPTKLGNWNVHGGIEYLRLGEMPTYANQQPAFYGAPITPGGGLSNEFVVSVGVSFSY